MKVRKEIRDGYVAIDGFDTLPKLFRNRVKKWGDRIAFREKNFGIWEAFTWNDFDRFAREVAGGLLSYGLEPGDVVAVLAEDNKEWVFADMGTMMAGGVVNGVYPTYRGAQIAYMLQDSKSRFLFVEDEEQLDKYLSVCDDLPDIEKVFVMDWKGLRGFTHPKVEPITHLYELGAQYLSANAGTVDARIDASTNDDLAVLIYTSGTTGKPKGAELPYRYLLFFMAQTPEPINIIEGDELLTYLPLCHAAERVFSLCCQLANGSVLNFAESGETVFQNIQELSPTVLFAVPRIWEKFYSRVATLVDEATWFCQTCYRLGVSIGKRRAEYLMAGKRPPVALELAFRIVDRLVFKNIKQLLGLDRARYLISGAAPISADLLQWYLALGLEITEIYGQTETGLVTSTLCGLHRPGTVGRPLSDVDVKLGAQNEILVRSPGLFRGYLNNEEGTKATLVDGWVHTGDVGDFDSEGNLRITDRLKDIIITAGGKNITPSLMENQLKFSPYISDAVIIGDKRKYLACLIMIDAENVEHFAQAHSIPFTDHKSLCAREEVIALIEGEIKKANEKFSTVEQIKNFRLIDVLLNPEDDELTPTMKLKRTFVEKKYEALIGEMY